MTATIQDVALSAGVSPSTVSRVLNRPEIVSKETVDRVRLAISTLKYTPNSQARGLRMGTLASIGLLVGDISQPFHSYSAKTTADAAERLGYSIMLGDLARREDRLLDLLQSIPNRGLAGVLVSTADDLDRPNIVAAILELERKGIPLMTTGYALRSTGLPTVAFDSRRIGQEAASHLMASGHLPLVVLAGGPNSWYSREIEAGVRDAAGVSVPVHVLDAKFQHAPARDAMRPLLKQGVRSGGIVAANTPVAMGALRALAEAGLAVPADFGIVVCENVPLADYVTPPLTTVGGDIAACNAAALELLVRRIDGAKVPPVTILPHAPVFRTSTRWSPTPPSTRRRQHIEK